MQVFRRLGNINTKGFSAFIREGTRLGAVAADIGTMREFGQFAQRAGKDVRIASPEVPSVCGQGPAADRKLIVVRVGERVFELIV